MSDTITLAPRDYRGESVARACYFCDAEGFEVGASFPAGEWERVSFDYSPKTLDACWRCCVGAWFRIPATARKHADEQRRKADGIDYNDGDHVVAALMRWQAAGLDLYAAHYWELDDATHFYALLARANGVELVPAVPF